MSISISQVLFHLKSQALNTENFFFILCMIHQSSFIPSILFFPPPPSAPARHTLPPRMPPGYLFIQRWPCRPLHSAIPLKPFSFGVFRPTIRFLFSLLPFSLSSYDWQQKLSVRSPSPVVACVTPFQSCASLLLSTLILEKTAGRRFTAGREAVAAVQTHIAGTGITVCPTRLA